MCTTAKMIAAALGGALLFSSLPALAAEKFCKDGMWEIPNNKTLCFRKSMEQYLCSSDKNGDMKFRFIQKISVSSLKERCDVIDEVSERPESQNITR